ncbi:DUF1257 domain-containing protein [Leptolyngbya sp. FACHB-541]|uniref:DUF1257 domain-containing protein n=1 Tax=Leptolyngbya sp. FACHB-541 TaxID=2692810 RepID=UPI001685FAC9|nr:DUF1257 domain-containing protein [Leptolyngbya sp. FACHB-541]MBD1995346.1 DUF1257 domain-containing protein [Leptolyngbya sp. FACHB-541]
MSHFSRLRSQLVDREILIATLREMGLDPQVAEAGKTIEVCDYDGRSNYVDIAVSRHSWGGRSDIGFKFNPKNNSYEVVADLWDVESCRKGLIAWGREGVGGDVMVQYARTTNLRILQAKGFKVDSEQVIDGQLTIKMVRTAQRTTAQTKTATRSTATRHNQVRR